MFSDTHFQSGDNIFLGEFPQDHPEVRINQTVDVLRAVNSWHITQLRRGRGAEAHEARDHSALPAKNLRSPAAARRLGMGEKRRRHLFIWKPKVNHGCQSLTLKAARVFLC